MLNPPFSMPRREGRGSKNMGSAVKAIGPYQATARLRDARRGRKANEDTLVKYLQAYVEGVRWSLDPAEQGRRRSASSPNG